MTQDDDRAQGRPLTVVGIGASAGGLDACRRLVALLPVDPDVAFILIQHLDPTHESMMAPLLASHTAMPVRQAEDGMALEGGALFIIPPGGYLGLGGGVLTVTAPQARHGARLPFDFLLHALARECGAHAVCIVLSGTGADGSQGLRALHDAGGLVIAQEPSEAEYDGMPQSAIATGMVDLVLPLAQMPAALAEAARNGPGRGRARAPDPVTPRDAAQESALAQIVALLRAETRHDFSLYKTGTLMRRLERRMAAAAGGGVAAGGDIAVYLERLRRDAGERDMLARDLLIHVTSFFRDPPVFEHLAATVAPELIAEHTADRPVRIWVAGCSTGEEAYSLGMVFFEALAGKPDRQVQILASDADPEAIAGAREGFYPDIAVEHISPERLARFFVREDAGWRVIASLRDAVVFTVHDVLKDPPFSRIDLVSCRNLMIYLGPEAQARAVSLFHFALRPGGVLLLGAAETVGAPDGRFEAIDKLARLYRRVGRARAGDVAFLLSESARAPERPTAGQTPKRQSALGDVCRTALLDAYAPTAVLINRRFECLHFCGPTGRYLRIPSGAPSRDFLAIAPPALRSRIRAAAQRAFETGALATVTGGTVGAGAGAEGFSIEMRPVEVDGEALVLACFIAAPPSRAALGHDADAGTGRLAALERELEITRTELRGAIHTLETASEEQATVNAEALSVNEEFQSTNEELLASKEELQSLNEELTALNSQLQETLERHRTTAADLQNVLYSTDVATLCLDMNLRIRFFTPAARALFSIIATDVGRPLSDLAAKFRDDALEADARTVLKGGVEAEGREVLSESGSWHMRCIQPYRTGDGRVEGVVITFADITERKRAAEALEAARRAAEHANLAKSRFLAAASHDLRQPLQSLTLIHGLLAKAVKTPQAQTLLVRFDETLGVMASMLNAVLDVNQIEAGVVQPTLADVPLGPLLDRLCDEFGYLAQERGLRLRAAPTSAVVRSDARLMEQMLRNLIANALKYTNKGGVLVGCRPRGDRVCVEVWDTGVGVAGADLDPIFEEYHQIGNPARERSRGLGLGLSIVKRLGLMLDHPVSVRSTPRRGSVFAFCAPRALGVTPTSLAEDAPHGVVAGEAAPVTILLIDDDDAVRDLTEQLLRAEGLTVFAAHDGASAIRRVVEDGLRPDLALIDYNLPNGLHGLEVAERLRAHLGSGLPVVVLTGDISAATLSEVRAARCTRLSKPVAPGTLIAAIAKLSGAAPASPTTP